MIEQLAKGLLNYLSDIIGVALPDDPGEKELNTIKNSTVSAYAIAKTFGADIVESTENDIDDKVLEELIETCEDMSEKYAFSLNAQDY